MNVTLIDSMGSDLSVVNAARVSFDKESDWEIEADEEIRDGKLYYVNHRSHLSGKDTKLISYLAKHNHWSPFAHAFASFRIKAPIFVARQLVKHQVGLAWNEVSRRYVDSTPELYVPDGWRMRADNVKQGSSDEDISFCKVMDLQGNTSPIVDVYEEWVRESLHLYDKLITKGVCPEQARMVLPQSMMTEWIWSGSLMAFARVCQLRLDNHTQQETRQIAAMINTDMEALFPISWKALQNG
jgi:thymidylate synthase (FAD)